MQLEITKKELQALLVRAVVATDPKNILDALGNAHLTATEAGHLRVKTTNMVCGLTLSTECDLIQEGSVVTAALALLSVVKSLPDGTVGMRTTPNGSLSINSGKTKFTLPTLPKNTLPHIQTPSEPSWGEMPGEVLTELLLKSSFAASTDETKYHMNGVCLAADGTAITAMAVNGYVLTKTSATITGLALEKPVIVPLKGATIIEKIVDPELPVQVCFSEGYMYMRQPGVDLGVKLVDADFPDLASVFLTEVYWAGVFNTDELLGVLRRATVLKTEARQDMRLELCTDTINIESGVEGQGAVADAVPVRTWEESSVDLCHVTIDPEALSRILKSFKSNYGVIGYAGPLQPVLIRPWDDQAFDQVCVQMPRREA